jgi:hypothetical protein
MKLALALLVAGTALADEVPKREPQPPPAENGPTRDHAEQPVKKHPTDRRLPSTRTKPRADSEQPVDK